MTTKTFEGELTQSEGMYDKLWKIAGDLGLEQFLNQNVGKKVKVVVEIEESA